MCKGMQTRLTISVYSIIGILLYIITFFSTKYFNYNALRYLLIVLVAIMLVAKAPKSVFVDNLKLNALYVVLPSFAKTNVVFNYVTWFAILFVIASYIRLYPKAWFNSSKTTGILAVVSLILSWISIAVLAMISKRIGGTIGLAYFFVSDSNKVLALTTAVNAFLFFRNLKLRNNKVINTVAASTFGVLLIHANSDAMRRWLWRDVCNNVAVYESGNVVGHAIGCVLLIYTVCTIIDIIRVKVFDLVWRQ